MANKPSPSSPPANASACPDEMWMSIALECAQQGGSKGEVPVGAVVVREGRVIGKGNNRTIRDADPTAHAEVVALRAAAQSQGDWRLSGATLYVTLEPCSMCAGAIVLSRIARVVFAAHDPKAGMGGSLDNILQDKRLNHYCEVDSGILSSESSSLLKSFFRQRR
ncbi:MAG: tRNA adenosine(34) deaminase TadA [Gemmatimonadaceae bacterium]|nr:tRNA adenosine(34) deaminase TadA [Gemmatimonadaceae bacterium]